jgi:hypothetical protein
VIYYYFHIRPFLLFIMQLLICGSLISPVTLSSYRALVNALIYVNDRGIIEYVRECDLVSSELAIQSFLYTANIPSHSIHIIRLKRGEFLVPGFVDTHTVSIWQHTVTLLNRHKNSMLLKSLTLGLGSSMNC